MLDRAIEILQKARMIRPAAPEGERGHKAYTRVVEGKMQQIHQKGTVLKERQDVRPEASEGLKSKDAKEFSQLINSYFYIQKEMGEMKNLIKQHEDELSSVMGKIRPFLSKMDNLEKEENKFRTEFTEGDWSYKFLQFTRESKPYKDLYVKAFNMLNEKAQTELKTAEEALKSITAQEKFERKPIEKAVKGVLDDKVDKEKTPSVLTKDSPDSNAEDTSGETSNGAGDLITSMKNLVDLRSKGLELLKLFFGYSGKEEGSEKAPKETGKKPVKELKVKEPKVEKKPLKEKVEKKPLKEKVEKKPEKIKEVKKEKEMKNEEPKEKKKIKKSVLVKAIQTDSISERLADILIGLIMKSRVKPFVRTKRGKLERVTGFERRGDGTLAYKRPHESFSKLKVGDVLTDNTGEKFEVLEIDKPGQRAFVKDKQSPKDKFWLPAKFINKPQLLSIENEGIEEPVQRGEAPEGTYKNETDLLLEQAYTIFETDKLESKKIKKDFDEWLEDKNKEAEAVQKRDGFEAELVVPTKEMAVLFGTEIDGQISDGMWENSPRLQSRYGGIEPWMHYTFAKIKVDPSQPVTLYSSSVLTPKINFGRLLTSKGLMGRMLWKVRNSVNSTYAAWNLRNDIKKLKGYTIGKIVKDF